MAYRVELTPEVERHLDWLTVRERAIAIVAMRAQLRDEPAAETRNRKLLRENAIARWELRLGDLRVFYDVFEEPAPIVAIRAVGRKVRDRLFIAGEEIIL